MNRRIFDGVIIIGLLLHAAVIPARMAARRWAAEDTGALGTAGRVIQIGLGR